ncbi:MAG: hypothetical protein F6K09_03540 [Merismopedia sp. SIO2A8]|nr:hypothetical protein [Merismopedia sp. SIO2A8]
MKIATANGYDHGYIKDTGAQLWRSLSQEFNKKVTKSNVRNIISKLAHQESVAGNADQPTMSGELTAQISPQEQALHPVSNPSRTNVRQSWDESLDIGLLYGRTEELRCLESWVTGHALSGQSGKPLKLLTLLGMGGVGKTALSVQLVKQVTSQFDYVAWRSLRQAPPSANLLPDLILFLSDQQDIQTPNTTDQQISAVLSYMRQKRCLLVLDNLEAILQTGERVGAYRKGYEDYRLLLERIADETHQSCVILTSREMPMGLAWREMDGGQVKTHLLTGLSSAASQDIFNTAGLKGSPQQHQELSDRYSGNPLALKIVAATIRSVFSGDVAAFLTYGSVVFGDIWDLLDQQFNRLSEIEQTVMRWLAINRDWTSLSELRADIVPAISHRALLEAVESLKGRSLIETSPVGITQQAVVMEYMTERLVEQFHHEIEQKDWHLFCQYALLKADAKEFIRESQIRQVSQPLLEKLEKLETGWRTVHPNQPMEAQLREVLQSFRQQPMDQVGYAGGNILNLLCQLDADLQGQDLSHLPLWQVHLSGKNLQGVNLSHADLSKSVFSESLGSAITAAFSPDGQRLAVGDTNGEIHVWQVASGQKTLGWKAHTGWIWSVVFSPDGKQLASGAEDRTLRVWDSATGELLATLEGHDHRVASMVWHPDGQQLFSGSEDGTAKVWHWQTQSCVQTVSHKGAIAQVTLSSDGKRLAGGSAVTSTILLWDLEQNACIQTFEGHDSGVRTTVFIPNDQRLISASIDQTIRVWDVETGDCLAILEGHQGTIWSVVVSDNPYPHNQHIMSASNDQTVKIWDLASGQCLRTLHGFAARVWSVALNPQSSVLATCDDRGVKLWDVGSGQCLKTFRGYPQVNWTVSFSPIDGTLASGGGQDHKIQIWDMEQKRCRRSLSGHQNYVQNLCHHPTEPILASAAHHIIHLWNLETGQTLYRLEEHKAPIWKVVFSHDGQYLASSCFDQTTKVWDWRTGHCVWTLQGHSSWVFGVDFSPDGRWLATSSMDQTIKLWDALMGECVRTIQVADDQMPDVTFSPDGDYLVGGGVQGQLMMWAMNRDAPPRIVQGHAGFVSGVRFSPDGKMLASSSHDRTIKLWDAVTLECLKTLVGHENMVSGVAFSADGSMVASASHDETVRVWDVATGECREMLRSPRPYEGMNIEGATGLVETQKATLKILGAVDI